MSAPLILTLQLDPQSAQLFNDLRQTHFPSARNHLKAHVTLFHALKGEQQSEIEAVLSEICAQCAPFEIRFPAPMFLGRGVAIAIESPELLALQRALQTRWSEQLSPQDRQKWRPHITVQNKVAPEKARALFEQFSQSWRVRNGQGTGLSLWHYRGGPWELARDFEFEKTESGAQI